MIILLLFIVLGLGHISSRIISIRHIRLVHVLHSGSELSESNEVGVKYGFIYEWKKFLLLKSISQFTKKRKQTNNQTNKERKRKRKQAYAIVDLDLDDS